MELERGRGTPVRPGKGLLGRGAPLRPEKNQKFGLDGLRGTLFFTKNQENMRRINRSVMAVAARACWFSPSPRAH